MATDPLRFALINIGFPTLDEFNWLFSQNNLQNNAKKIKITHARIKAAMDKIIVLEGQEAIREIVQIWMGSSVSDPKTALFQALRRWSVVGAIVAAVQDDEVKAFCCIEFCKVPVVKREFFVELRFYNPHNPSLTANLQDLTREPEYKPYIEALLKEVQGGTFQLMELSEDVINLVVICQPTVSKWAKACCMFKHFNFTKEQVVETLALPKDYEEVIKPESPCVGWDRRWALELAYIHAKRGTEVVGGWIGSAIASSYKYTRDKPAPDLRVKAAAKTFGEGFVMAGSGSTAGWMAALETYNWLTADAYMPYGLAFLTAGTAFISVGIITSVAVYFALHYGKHIAIDILSWFKRKAREVFAILWAKIKGVVGPPLNRVTATVGGYGRAASGAMGEGSGRGSAASKGVTQKVVRTFTPPPRFLPPVNTRWQSSAVPPTSPTVPPPSTDVSIAVGPPSPFPQRKRAGSSEAELDLEEGRPHKRQFRGNASWACSAPMDIKVSKANFPEIKTADEVLPAHLVPLPSANVTPKSCSGKVRLTLKVPETKNGLKVLYWAAKKPKDGKVKDRAASYGDYSNLGVTRADKGQVTFCLDEPRVYSVKGKIYAPHLHFAFASKDEDKWQPKVYSLYVPRRACGVKGLVTYDARDEGSYSLSTPLLLKGLKTRQKRLARRLAAKSMYNVFFSV